MTLSDFGASSEKAARVFMKIGVSLEGEESAKEDCRKAEIEMCGARGTLTGLITALSYGEAIDFDELSDVTEKYWILRKFMRLRAEAHI